MDGLALTVATARRRRERERIGCSGRDAPVSGRRVDLQRSTGTESTGYVAGLTAVIVIEKSRHRG
jgi:hypothetical protein